jgi:hypothetical protein
MYVSSYAQQMRYVCEAITGLLIKWASTCIPHLLALLFLVYILSCWLERIYNKRVHQLWFYWELNCFAIRTFPPSMHDLSFNMLKKTAVLSGRLAEASTPTPPPFTSAPCLRQVKPLSPPHVLVAVGIVGDLATRHTCKQSYREAVLGHVPVSEVSACQAVLLPPVTGSIDNCHQILLFRTCHSLRSSYPKKLKVLYILLWRVLLLKKVKI